MITMDTLFAYLRGHLEARGVVRQLQQIQADKSSKAGASLEPIFNKEFVCPAIADFFLEEHRHALGLTDEQIRSGLGAEGSVDMPNHTFTPSLGRDYFFTKGQVLKTKPPAGWFDPEKLTSYRSYADFAVRRPLPLSLVGELKYEHQAKSREKSIGVIYEVTRQCVFYLGAFGQAYDAAVALIADATEGHLVYNTFEEFPPALRRRYGAENRLFMLILRLN